MHWERAGCTGKEWDALGKSGQIPVPPAAAAKTPSLALSTVAPAGEAHNVFEMLNYSEFVISLVLMQQLTTCLF